MALLDIAAWGVLGATVHGLAQGLRRKPFGYKPYAFVVSAALFAGVGVALDGVRASQKEFLDRRVSLLLEQRKQRGVDVVRE